LTEAYLCNVFRHCINTASYKKISLDRQFIRSHLSWSFRSQQGSQGHRRPRFSSFQIQIVKQPENRGSQSKAQDRRISSRDQGLADVPTYVVETAVRLVTRGNDAVDGRVLDRTCAPVNGFFTLLSHNFIHSNNVMKTRHYEGVAGATRRLIHDRHRRIFSEISIFPNKK